MIMLGIDDGSRLMAIAFIKRCQICIQFFPQMHLEIQAHLNLPSTNIPNMGTGTHEHVHKLDLHMPSLICVCWENFSALIILIHNPLNPNKRKQED